MMLERFGGLATYLRRSAPRDVLMPVAPDSKRPRFVHRGGLWRWSDFDRYCEWAAAPGSGSDATGEAADACVLLHDLCVVDVDTEEQAVLLERRFPAALASAPCERTARGRHYWFRRSTEADRDGYYDGAAQVTKGVDFKTRTRGGTGGVVVVAPSGERRWLRGRALGVDMEPPTIPSELLRAVARPKHPSRVMTLRFVGTDEERSNPSDPGGSSCACACSMPTPERFQYFEPFLSNEIAAGRDDDPQEEAAIVVPCTRADFQNMCRALGAPATDSRNRLATDAVSVAAAPLGYEEVTRALVTADLLGYSNMPELRRRLLVGGDAMWLRDLVELWPGMAAALVEETDVHTGGPSCASRDLRDPELQQRMQQHRELCIAQLQPLLLWLDSPSPAAGAAAGQREREREREGAACNPPAVVGPHACKILEERLPPAVATLLREHKLVLAGGAVLALLRPEPEMPHDYDLFAYGLDEKAADAMLADVASRLLPSPAWKRLTSSCAHTFIRESDDLIVQVVLRLYDRPEQVACSFDVAPCKVGVWWYGGGCGGVDSGNGGINDAARNPDTDPALVPASTNSDPGRFEIHAAPSWIESVAARAFPVDVQRWSNSSVARTLKYGALRGFDVVLPGLRRAYVRSGCSTTAWGQRGMVLPRGVAGLLRVEELRRKGCSVPWIFRQLRGATSDYAGVLKTVPGALAAAVRLVFSRTIAAVRAVFKAARWRFADADAGDQQEDAGPSRMFDDDDDDDDHQPCRERPTEAAELEALREHRSAAPFVHWLRVSSSRNSVVWPMPPRLWALHDALRYEHCVATELRLPRELVPPLPS